MQRSACKREGVRGQAGKERRKKPLEQVLPCCPIYDSPGVPGRGGKSIVLNRPGVAGAVLQTHLLLVV